MGKHKEAKIRESAGLSMVGILLVIGAGLLAWHFPDSPTGLEIALIAGVLGAILCLVGNRN